MSQPKVFSTEDVAKHNKEGDLWLIVDSKVYDLSKFANLHPGGKSVLLEDDVAGQDATEIFFGLHKGEVLLRPQYQRLVIGTVKDEQPLRAPAPPGSLSQIPYGEAQWLVESYRSPYYKESHRRLQQAMRKLCDEVVIPEAKAREADGKRFTNEFIAHLGSPELNVLAMRMGPGAHLKGRKLLNGVVSPEEFDYFHELIVQQEVARSGQRGFIDGFLSGMIIGLTTINNFATDAVKKELVELIVTGQKFISLAITEAFAGSDVAGLRTSARLTEDKKHWIVTGTKKWITNGTFSDYFATACRTSDDKLTMILVPRGPGVSTKPIKTAYSATAGTAFITFDAVKVPVEYTLGKVGDGLKVVLSNFNHERWMMCCNNVQGQRNIVDETLRWATLRQVFGKPLMEQAVVRQRLAGMISRLESSHAWLEHVTYQMCNMNYANQSRYLAGNIALLKQYVTRAATATANDATQIFGGRSITQTGMGAQVEQFHRTAPFDAILGGTEDVLADLGVKQAIKYAPKNLRL